MSDLLSLTREKVRGYLQLIYGDKFIELDDRFIVSEGSARIMIVPRPWHEDDTVVECMAYLVAGAEITNDLMLYLLRKNATGHFGAFGITFDNTIVFSHSVAGKNLDKNEFEASLRTVAIIADYFDDEIRKNYGGVRAGDTANAE